MELSDLTTYAQERYGIIEQHKWDRFSGFSVLVDPSTNKWSALLMRQWSSDLGEEIQHADIKCGPLDELLMELPFLFPPFRMKSSKWVGVVFAPDTNEYVVRALLDKALSQNSPINRFTITLDAPKESGSNIYRDTPLGFSVASFADKDSSVPKPIVKMLSLYDYGDGSFDQKCKNFFVQGSFMEDYCDDKPWAGDVWHYVTTYHDLNIPQLRGYFTWRTRYRAGDVQPTSTSFAYIYVYELLNGIGTSSKEDALQKLDEFVEKFIDSGIGDKNMKRYLDEWRCEFAIVHDFPVEVARRYANQELIERDEALEVLKVPDDHDDEEVYAAMTIFAKKRASISPVLRKHPKEGVSLFAEVWRQAARDGLFKNCFGVVQDCAWYPFANAVVWRHKTHADTTYHIDASWSYRCKDGVWTKRRYESIFFNTLKFEELFRGTDRILRKRLRTGRYLKDRESEQWVEPFVDAAIQAVKKAKEKAARPKIEIDVSQLDKIRDDAALTRESLLTEEELENDVVEALSMPNKDAHKAAFAAIEAEGTKEVMALEAPLDDIEIQVLTALLDGKSAKALIKAKRLMASIVADSINEALFDEVDDNVVESDGNDISLVEDYRKNVEGIVRGT